MVDNLTSMHNWFTTYWFKPSTLQNFDWDQSWAFYLLILIPLIYLIRWAFLRKGQKIAIALREDQVNWDPQSLFRFLPHIFIILTLLLLTIALARPQKTNEQVEQWTEGIDIMLVLDISESMRFEDFKPNRLEAAKSVAHDFVAGRFQDRIGLVIFSGEAYSLSPLTSDYDLLYYYIDDLKFDKIESPGTAIGSALAVATNRMRESESKSKVLILLSDGENNTGNIDPTTAAKLANVYNIKIYTIAVGKEGKIPVGTYFGIPQYQENTLDETTLRDIAEIGDGQFFRVGDNKALEDVFKKIDQYEKAEIKETRYRNTSDFYQPYLLWGIIFFLLWLFSKSTFMASALYD